MPDRSPSLLRKFLFGLVIAAIVLTFATGALELGLRASGSGHSPHFFRSATTLTGESVLRENRWVTAPFFGENRARRPWPLRLPVEKAPEACRIFVLGSSAAMGDPEPSFSLARMLEQMLAAAYPEIRFEVVNAAVTAINSHVLRGIAADCAEQAPDIFVIYEGNNEVIGPFGPANVFAAFQRSPALVAAARHWQRSRIGQAVQTLTTPDAEADDAEWGGMGMFLEHTLAADDPRLDTVRAHFATNLRAITAAAIDAGATPLLCTSPVNLRDFAPFQSAHRTDLTAEARDQWQEHFAAGDAALAAGDALVAERHYRAALNLDDTHAELVFRLGRLALQRRDFRAAAELLTRARDLDTLRFRTDSGLNATVREVAASLPRGGLVDLETELARAATGGVPGDDLFYEHVHLNFHGTYVAARTLFPRIAADLVERGRVSRYVGEPFGEAEARRRLGYNAHEQTMIALELVRRFERAPFTAQSDNAQRIFAWSERAERGQELLQQSQSLAALQLGARESLQRNPHDWVLRRNTGAMLVARGDAAAALPLLQAAADWIDDDVDTLLALGLAQRDTGNTEAARATFARVRELEPDYPGIPTLGETL